MYVLIFSESYPLSATIYLGLYFCIALKLGMACGESCFGPFIDCPYNISWYLVSIEIWFFV